LGPLRRRAGRPPLGLRLRGIFSAHATQVVLVVLFLAATGLYSAMRGGQYEAFVAEYGSAGDLAARALGLGIAAITITGERELVESDILAAARIGPRNSLLFLDVAAVRDRLKQIRLVQDVSVRKLYPDRLLIEITERRPFALWQKDGVVALISADGTVLDEVRDALDAGDADLPFVVGDGANTRVGEFMQLVAAAADIGPRIRAGVLVSGRRWDLKMDSGLEVILPEADPVAAVTQFARLAHDDQLLDKDLISVDLRIPGRLVARISEEAAAARAQALAKKHAKRAPT
jgi:cell division protein FtsQ